jgi:hypothetical protein
MGYIMRVQRQPNMHTCMITSLAMCMNVDVEQLIEEVGHDGSELLWPQNIGPTAYRGYHIDELSVLAMIHGYSCTGVTRNLCLGHNEVDCINVDPFFDFDRLIQGRTGLLLDDSHCVAWSGSQIYDPSKGIYEYNGHWYLFYHVTPLY